MKNKTLKTLFLVSFMFIVKVPGINGLGKTKGCEMAPNAVLETLKEIHSNEAGKPIDVRLLDLE